MEATIVLCVQALSILVVLWARDRVLQSELHQIKCVLKEILANQRFQRRMETLKLNLEESNERENFDGSVEERQD